MQPDVIRYSADNEYFFPEGCFINELSNSPADGDLSIAQARVRPGEGTKWHCLKGRVERYFILQGVGLVEIAGMAAKEVRPGDIVLIPPECPQRIDNLGEEDLIFLALCTPRFQPDAYVELI
jgi:mannose-6-phosphate isomerase-like protein (cupin superfamily)